MKKNPYDYERKPVWEKLGADERREVFSLAEDYKHFLDTAKTERLAVKEIVRRAEAAGFAPLSQKTALKPGDKVYAINRGKNAVLTVIGSEPLAKGINAVGSHIDSPRLDLKQNPLYEDCDLVLLKTHYYGGVRKYQWVARPLALHGTVVRADGSVIDVSVGDRPEDPVFYISDLLPHLSREQNEKKLSEAIEGEQLNIIIGGFPDDDNEQEKRFRSAILNILHEQYGMEEADFLSAEFEAVPAGPARDAGFDRSMIAAYGHDDRICAYASLSPILSLPTPRRTAVALFVDKEEVGSEGNTGMHGAFFTQFVSDLLALSGDTSERALRAALGSSAMLSADVGAGLDPTFATVSEAMNAAYMGRGVMLMKYSGVRGKSGSSDANAEFVGKVRKLLNDANITFQTSELGKVDQGGGGTIAYIMANLGMEVLDVGLPVISLHAPVELVNKADLYATTKTYEVFYKKFE